MSLLPIPQIPPQHFNIPQLSSVETTLLAFTYSQVRELSVVMLECCVVTCNNRERILSVYSQASQLSQIEVVHNIDGTTEHFSRQK